MKLLAIDPGTLRLGAALFDLDLERESAILIQAVSLVVKPWGPRELAAWLRDFADGCSVIAIEQPGDHPFQRQESATKLWHWIGAIEGAFAMLAVVENGGPEVRRVEDGDVKEALTGRRNGHKYEVHWALANMGYRLPVRETGSRIERCESCRTISNVDPRHSPDAADAIGVGHVCAAAIFMERRAL